MTYTPHPPQPAKRNDRTVMPCNESQPSKSVEGEAEPNVPGWILERDWASAFTTSEAVRELTHPNPPQPAKKEMRDE